MSRVSPGSMMAVVFAILVGLGGAYGMRQYLRSAPAETVEAELITVPVAAYDMNVGRTLAASDLRVLRMSSQEYRASRYSDGGFMNDLRQLSGRVLRQSVRKGDAIPPEGLYPEGTGPGIAELLEPGQMAVTIPVAGPALVGGFAGPGSTVDVIYRSNARDAEITMTLLERVQVLAMGRAVLPAQSAGEANTVTLGVSAYQAKALQAVQGRGDLTLALRSPEDTPTFPVGTESERIRLEQILGILQRPRGQVMDIYRGGSLQQVEFARDAALDPQFVIATPVGPEPPATPSSSGRPDTGRPGRYAN